MEPDVTAKRVELTELFYDLVFVFSISKITELLHGLRLNNLIEILSLFTVMMLVFINTWIVQMVYTNRYGKNSLTNIAFFMVDMAIVLFMSINLSEDITTWFQPISLAAGMLSITLVLQYLITYIKSSEVVDKQLSLAFVGILSLRSGLLLIASWLPIKWGIPVAIIGVLLAWILPGTLNKLMVLRPINFPHLLERLTALIIIAFGEMLINIAIFFKLSNLNLNSIVIFVTICALFMTYITQFDHWIEERQQAQSGITLIYLHYLILFGISLLTISFDFTASSNQNIYVLISLYFVGLALFYAGIFVADRYNKAGFIKSRYVMLGNIILWIVGLIVASTFTNIQVLLLVGMMLTVVNAFVSSWNMLTNLKNSKSNNEV